MSDFLVKGADKNCPYYPCHDVVEDCTFCYCVFYPCLKSERGGYWKKAEGREDVWACEKCTWIHRSDVVRSIYEEIRK